MYDVHVHVCMSPDILHVPGSIILILKNLFIFTYATFTCTVPLTCCTCIHSVNIIPCKYIIPVY